MSLKDKILHLEKLRQEKQEKAQSQSSEHKDKAERLRSEYLHLKNTIIEPAMNEGRDTIKQIGHAAVINENSTQNSIILRFCLGAVDESKIGEMPSRNHVQFSYNENRQIVEIDCGCAIVNGLPTANFKKELRVRQLTPQFVEDCIEAVMSATIR